MQVQILSLLNDKIIRKRKSSFIFSQLIFPLRQILAIYGILDLLGVCLGIQIATVVRAIASL